MKPPPGFHALMSGLHQDALMLAEGNMEKLVMSCIESVPKDLKRELQLYLAHVLDKHIAAELKGILNREKRALAFNSDGAELFFELSRKKLTEKPRRGPA